MSEVSEFFSGYISMQLISMIHDLHFYERKDIIFLENEIKLSSLDRIISFQKGISLCMIMVCCDILSYLSFRFLVLRIHREDAKINLLCIHLKDFIPVDAFPNIGNIFDSAILILEIIGMFSYINGK